MVDYPKPNQSVDVVLLTLHQGHLCVLLAPRPSESDLFPGALALPGGYIHTDEDDDLLATAHRVLRGKAGVAVPYMEQLYTFSGKYRDPRGWSTSVAYISVVPALVLEAVHGAGPEAPRLYPVETVPALPFDHNEIVKRAVVRLRGKSTYSSLPTLLLPKMFTMSELRTVYEQTLGLSIPKVTFRRKIEALGIVEPVCGLVQAKGASRPAQFYRRTSEALMEFDQAF